MRTWVALTCPLASPVMGRRAAVIVWCDACWHLQGRGSSVFSPPGRCCLSVSSHGLATAAQRSGGGPGLSIQSWHLLGRIRELDCWLQAQPQRSRQLLECHPELTFLQLQQRYQPRWSAPASKHQPSGQDQRLQLLDQHWGWDSTSLLDEALARSRRHCLQRHDLVDALAVLLWRWIVNGKYYPAPQQRTGQACQWASPV